MPLLAPLLNLPAPSGMTAVSASHANQSQPADLQTSRTMVGTSRATKSLQRPLNPFRVCLNLPDSTNDVFDVNVHAVFALIPTPTEPREMHDARNYIKEIKSTGCSDSRRGRSGHACTAGQCTQRPLGYRQYQRPFRLAFELSLGSP